MSSLLLSKTDIGLKHFFAHNVRYGNSATFRIWVALEFLQYLDNHEPQQFDFCIECTPNDRICQLYHHQVKIMFIYEGTNNLVSGAFLNVSVYFLFCTYLYVLFLNIFILNQTNLYTPTPSMQPYFFIVQIRNNLTRCVTV